jgi:hypothetical protein
MGPLVLISPRKPPIIDEVPLLSPPAAWKVVLAVVLVGAIAVSACAGAPRRPVPRSDLRRLVLSALTLYGVGVLASLTHHVGLAAAVYVAGICACALAAWLSRGGDTEDPPDADEPVDEQPPPEPDGIPAFDWRGFEREFRRYADRRRDPTGTR